MTYIDFLDNSKYDIVLDQFDLYTNDFLLTEDEEYREFCEFVDSHEIITEGLLGKITGKLRSKLDFMKDISTKLNLNFGSLVKMFKDSRVFKFFHRIGWSFQKLYDLLKKGFKLGHNLADAIAQYMAETKVAKWTQEELRKLDNFLKKHPKTRRIVGIGVAAILAYIWFNMTFTGSFEYDFGMGDLLGALTGKMVLADIFAGKDGIKLLMLFTTGLLGLSFPWPGPGTIKFVAAIVQTIAKKIKYRGLSEATVSGTYPDVGGISSDDDRPPGNILIGTAMKWRRVTYPQGSYKIYEPVDDFKWNRFPNVDGQDKVGDYNFTLDRDPLKSLFGGRLFKYMTRKKEAGFKDQAKFMKLKGLKLKKKDIEERPKAPKTKKGEDDNEDTGKDRKVS